MPVRVRPSALIAPLACDGRHATLRRSKTRFDSWQGHCAPSPRVCRTHGGLRSRKAGFDSRVGGSRAVLFRSLSSECDGRAHDSAKVEDQVQFLARTWLSDRGSKHSRRRSLTARRRSAKPQKRVRLPPAPLSVCPVVPLSWFTRTDRIEHVAVGVGRRELLAPIRRLIKPCPMRVGPTHRRVPQPGRARNRQGASQAGSCQTANDGSDKSGMGVPRSIETRNKTHACMALRRNETKKNTVLRIRMGRDQGRGRCLVALA